MSIAPHSCSLHLPLVSSNSLGRLTGNFECMCAYSTTSKSLFLKTKSLLFFCGVVHLICYFLLFVSPCPSRCVDPGRCKKTMLWISSWRSLRSTRRRTWLSSPIAWRTSEGELEYPSDAEMHAISFAILSTLKCSLENSLPCVVFFFIPLILWSLRTSNNMLVICRLF